MTTAAATTPRTLAVALVGNPNTGKTTLFNALSGLRQQVGNYPGVTVEKKLGTAHHDGHTLHLIDLPGTYSLAPRSPDELVALKVLVGRQIGEESPDVILNIIDASNLERHLFLTTQLLDLGRPVVVALNMPDLAAAQGITIDAAALGRSLGVPVIEIQANTKRGLAALKDALVNAATAAAKPTGPEMPPEIRAEVTRLRNALDNQAAADEPGVTFLFQRLVLDAGGAVERLMVERYGPEAATLAAAARARLEAAKLKIPGVETKVRYAWIRERTAPCVQRRERPGPDWTARIDRVLTHKVAGMAVFLLLMFLVFQAIYIGAEPIMNLIEESFQNLGEWIGAALPPGPLRSLVVEGVIAGVGSVVIFLPQIVILFGFIAILEDCGYMARAAFLMDKVMARCGLSGKSFIPLLSSFACAIPGVMATRVIEDRRDRLATMLVAPLMSCSARLPVYSLLIGAFIPAGTWLGVDIKGLTLFLMYLIGIVVAPPVAWVLKRTLLRGETPIFLMELPPYRWPTLGTVVYRMYDRGKAFVVRAGTIILASMILVWALLYFPLADGAGSRFDLRAAALEGQMKALPEEATAERERIGEELDKLRGAWKRQSYLGRVGHFIEPAVAPLGWDWRIGTAALASFPAREVVVGVLGILFDVGEVGEDTMTLARSLAEAKRDGPGDRPLFTLPVALSLMVFFALCCQCASTLAVIRRESNSWAWPAFAFIYMTGLAYLAALAVYQIGSRWGG